MSYSDANNNQKMSGGANRKQGLPPSVGLGQFANNIIQRKAGFCRCIPAKQSNNTIVGYFTLNKVKTAYQIKNGIFTNLTTLPTFPTASASYANGVTADGSVIVGFATISGINSAFQIKNGIFTNLASIYFPSATFSNAYWISTDGTTIVGSATISGKGSAFQIKNGIFYNLLETYFPSATDSYANSVSIN